MPALPVFRFDNSYARELDGMSVPWRPAPSPAPRWLRLNRELASALGLDADALASPEGLAVFAGNALPEGATPVAQAYAGHQFGGFSPQLGDGRALLLGEQIDPQGRRFDIAFKGSGRTPFSRGGDGKAALGPVLREYLMGEAMHALGIPTSRALAAVATGEPVLRERALPGALLTRVASSHIRVGTFQYFAARRDTDRVRRLADHAIARHDPALAGQPGRHLALLRAVCERQALLLARWMGVGFIHGVMNTDNMTISGETIDYGPCAFMEAYDPACVFSSIDTQGRYAYGNQPGIAQWNLARLAETLVPLIHPDAEQAVAQATEVLNGFAQRYGQHWLAVMRAKLGLADGTAHPAGAPGLPYPGTQADADEAADRALANDYLDLMHRHAADFTLAFRRLSEVLRGRPEPLQRLLGADAAPALSNWMARWQARLQATGRPWTAAADAMDAVNPIIIPRNHLVERALEAAVDHDQLAPFEALLGAITQPYHERPEHAAYAEPAPPEQTAGYRTFCGT